MTRESAVAYAAHVPVALLADRDASSRLLYRASLAADNWSVDETDDGREALAKALTAPPNLVVTEARLPGITGYDLCSLLRRDAATRHVPIVVLTEDASPAAIERARESGANSVLVKPCLPEKLVTEIRKVVAQSPELRNRTHAGWQKATRALARSERVLAERRRIQSHAFERYSTTTPPVLPPLLVCPICDQPLVYERSHIGGVSMKNPEQWDYFECPARCGRFEHRQRTRKVRRVG
jgi:CheY-like chemotaxis protein